MPVLFIGHGSPMNALANNRYTQTLSQLGKKIPTPKAILVLSAHWLSQGTWVTQMAKPRTIHDFGGFPQALFDVEYPAPGSPETAALIQSVIIDPKIQLDSSEWGLDHGTWSVLRHLYPAAEIPVLQMSLSYRESPEYHFKLGEDLARLREMGVLILGSGNIVHNLRKIQWDENAKPYDWAIEFDEWIKTKIEERNFKEILLGPTASAAGRLSVPTVDHYLPLLSVLGAASAPDELRFEYEEMQNGSISMRSFSFGLP